MSHCMGITTNAILYLTNIALILKNLKQAYGMLLHSCLYYEMEEEEFNFPLPEFNMH